MLQVFYICKQQIYSLSEYIPHKTLQCNCCTYAVMWQDFQIASRRLLSYVHLNFFFELKFYTTETINCRNYEGRSQDITNVGMPSCEESVIFFILAIIDTLSKNFISNPNMKYHDTQSSGSRAVACKQTDGRTRHS
jgi:hypothetical protein